MSNPLRLREMQERNGIKPKKSKEEKKREKERRRLKQDRKRRHSPDDRRSEHRHSLSPNHSSRHARSPDGRRSRSPMSASMFHDRERYSRDHGPSQGRRRNGRSPDYRHRDHSPAVTNRRRDDERTMWPRSDESDDASKDTSASLYPQSTYVSKRQRSLSPTRGERGYPPSSSKRYRRTPSPQRRSYHVSQRPRADDPTNDRAARLATMSSNAVALSAEREARLAALQEKERSELAADDAARVKSKGMASFLSSEQKKVFGGTGGLEERIRRGRGGLVGNIDHNN